jgi:S-adenosylmethionine hydrolase
MIVLFTDFELQGPYTGQMKAVLYQMEPGIPAIDSFADAPRRSERTGGRCPQPLHTEDPKGTWF